MNYTAIARRTGDWWAISVPEIKGVHSQAKRLDKVEAMARDAIALFLDVASDSFTVTVQPHVPAEVTKAVDARQELKAAAERSERATAAAARALVAKGFTVRDTGAMLGLSPQRVSQLAGRKATPVREANGRVKRATPIRKATERATVDA